MVAHSQSPAPAAPPDSVSHARGGVLPVRGSAVRELGLPLPPARMPAWRAGRPLKRWRYLGVYSAEVMLCVGHARVAGIPQRWWAVALPDGRLFERTMQGGGGGALSPGRARVEEGPVLIELELDESPAVEVASAHGRSYIWTAKRAPVGVHGRVLAGGESFTIDGGHGFIDESAGYHSRHTSWRWSAGVGQAEDGRALAWNLVDGVHDAPSQSERTVWVDGRPAEVGHQTFAPGLSGVGGLTFRRWSSREHSANRGLVRSRYSQPFGEFSGELPGGVRLARGFGVMEDHEVWW